jgi:lipoprotein-anchoring transpeptidase ErfK/SrfK
VTIRCRRLRARATLACVIQPRSFLLVALPLVCFLAACGATAGHSSNSQPPAAAKPHCRPGLSPLGSGRAAVAAVVPKHVRVYRRPGRKPFASFGRLNQNRFPTVFRVLAAQRRRDCRASWYRVQVPLRPNGVTGFVPAKDVELGTVRMRILVRISQRRLTLFRSGKPVLHATVAVGSSATPTPTGSYYVNQRLIPADTSGPFGPGAIGISAFSNVLTGWAQGGPIAIHGTNEPWSIGHAVSNGCIRVRNDVLRRIFPVTPAGTPVVIRQ